MPSISFNAEKCSSLTSEQSEAVHSTGSVLVIGGPGTGKTRVMTEAAAYTYEELSSNILCLTFSKSARREWVKRLRQRLLDFDFEVRTFHSFAWFMLGEPKILADWEQLSFFHHLAGPQAQEVCSAIERHKACGEELDPWNKPFLVKYQRMLKDKGLLDFNDLMLRALDKAPEQCFDRVFVDEYQDTSMAQYELLKKISSEVYVIDEPYQRIYGWRDADKRNVERVLNDFKPSSHSLTVTHRHSKKVLAFLEGLYERGMTTALDTEGEVLVHDVINQSEEVEKVRSLTKDGMPTLILCRERSQRLPYLDDFNVELSTDRSERDYYTIPKSDVRVMTMHSVKGLEAYRCIILGCNEGLIPHYRSHDLDEERNLFYTSCARGMNELHIITYGEPSRWLKKEARNG